MSERRNSMVVFGEDWGGHPSSTQHLIKHMTDDFDLLWVNSIGLRSPRFTRQDMARLCRKGLGMLSRGKGCVTESTPFPVKNVRAVPFYGSKWSGYINRKLIVGSLQSDLTAFQESPLLWISLPSALPVVGQLNERGMIYYCGDDFSQLAGVDHHAVSRMEDELVERADILLVASEKLAEKYHRHAPVLLPHGVDYDMFSSPVQRAPDLPEHDRIAGFYGNIADWIDVSLVREVALRMPHWVFVFVGPVNTDVSALTDLENVLFLGPRPHHLLPAYSQHWQVSLLPFRDCGQIRACNPLKLREYLAAGKPVVSVPFPAVEPFRDLVSVTQGVEEFSRAIEASLAIDPLRGVCGRKTVEQESWLKRAMSVKHLINERLA